MEVFHPLLIISARVLADAEHAPRIDEAYRALAKLTRSGMRLLLTESEPDQWFPTRSSDDNVLVAQSRLQQRLEQEGGELDGFYYVPRSMLTQDRNRLGALTDILGRYGADADNAHLISASRAFLKTAQRLGINAYRMKKGAKDTDRLITTLKALPMHQR